MNSTLSFNINSVSRVIGKKGNRIDAVIEISPESNIQFNGLCKITILTKDKDLVVDEEDYYWKDKVYYLIRDALPMDWKLCKNGWYFTKLLNCRVFIQIT